MQSIFVFKSGFCLTARCISTYACMLLINVFYKIFFQKTPEPIPYLHPLQALQAQYFLQAFAAVAPVFAQNEMYLGLLKEVSALCRNSDPVSQSTNIPFVPAVGPPGFNTFPQGFNSFSNSAALHNSYSNAASTIGTNSIRKSKTNAIPPPKDFLSTAFESSKAALTPSPEVLPEGNGDIEKYVFILFLLCNIL